MKLLPPNESVLQFELSGREKRLLLTVLKLYPCVPAAYPRLNRGGALPDGQADQHLLDDALAEHRVQCRRQLEDLLRAPERFTKIEAGSVLSLSREQLELLLGILNDIRVGSWIALGSPEDYLQAVNQSNAHHFWAMEVSGQFQMNLLAALEEV